eukprot:16370_1
MGAFFADCCVSDEAKQVRNSMSPHNTESKDGFDEEDIYLTKVQSQLLSFNSESSVDVDKVHKLLIDVAEHLNQFKSNINNVKKWKTFVEHFRNKYSKLLQFAHLDPFSKRVFDKPRGYSGDAVMLDMIYTKSYQKDNLYNKNVSKIGNILFEWSMETDSSSAVRNRGKFVGSFIDQLYEERKCKLNILSVACGHLREIESSKQFYNHNVNVFGFDQDELSLNQIKLDYIDKGYTNIATLNGQVKQLFDPTYCNKFVLNKLNEFNNNNNKYFDLIWSAGLYDYLKDKPERKHA